MSLMKKFQSHLQEIYIKKPNNFTYNIRKLYKTVMISNAIMTKDQKVVVRAIIQMMGAPKKHIEDTLKLYVDKIKEEHKGITVLKDYTSKAEKKKGSKLFNVFSELEFEVQGVEELVWFCFDYMPASVEIMEPESLVYSSHEFTDFLNDLQGRLHKVDMVIKNLSAENKVVKKNGATLVRNIIMMLLKDGTKDVKTLASNAGMPEKHVLVFLDALLKEGRIKKDKNRYSLP